MKINECTEISVITGISDQWKKSVASHAYTRISLALCASQGKASTAMYRHLLPSLSRRSANSVRFYSGKASPDIRTAIASCGPETFHHV